MQCHHPNLPAFLFMKSLQAKQGVLLQQLDSVDQECEELRTTLSDIEEDKAKLVEQLKEMQDKKKQVQHKLEAQQVSVSI